MNIPGVFAIFYHPADTFDISFCDVLEKSNDITSLVDWIEIDKVGFPSLNEEMAMQNGQNVFSVSLSWFSNEPILLNKAVFRVDMVDGTSYLIGTKDKPYTMFSRRFTDSGPKAKRGYSCSISYKNTHGLIKIVV